MTDGFKAEDRRQQVAEWGREAVRVLEQQNLDCTCEYEELETYQGVIVGRTCTYRDTDCPTHWPLTAT